MPSDSLLADLIRAMVVAETPPQPRRSDLLPELGPGEGPEPGPRTRFGRALRLSFVILSHVARAVAIVLRLIGKAIEHLPVQFLWRAPRR